MSCPSRTGGVYDFTAEEDGPVKIRNCGTAIDRVLMMVSLWLCMVSGVQAATESAPASDNGVYLLAATVRQPLP